MSENLHTDDVENSEEADDEDEGPYADADGEPLRCPECGEFVAVHYHPQGEFPANYAGFVAHCECAMGPQLSGETVEYLMPRWYADMVLEKEEDGKDWLEYYFHPNRDASSWTDGDDE